MKVRRARRLVLGSALVAAVGILLWVVSGGPPRLPADADHSLKQSEASCLSCHGSAGRRPRPVDHPPRDDCFSCHRDHRGVLHARPDAPTSIPGGWRDDPRRRPS